MLGPDITLEPILRVYRISTRTYHLLCVLVFFFLFLSFSCCPCCCWFGFARRPRSWWFSFTTCFQSLAEDDRRWNKWGRTAASPIRRAISHRCAFNAKEDFLFLSLAIYNSISVTFTFGLLLVLYRHLYKCILRRYLYTHRYPIRLLWPLLIINTRPWYAGRVLWRHIFAKSQPPRWWSSAIGRSLYWCGIWLSFREVSGATRREHISLKGRLSLMVFYPWTSNRIHIYI